MSKDNALAFVGQIMTAYKAIMKAEGSALERAIECGKYLTLAKENVEEAKPNANGQLGSQSIVLKFTGILPPCICDWLTLKTQRPSQTARAFAKQT
jgi:hypothetical protein